MQDENLGLSVFLPWKLLIYKSKYLVLFLLKSLCPGLCQYQKHSVKLDLVEAADNLQLLDMIVLHLTE